MLTSKEAESVMHIVDAHHEAGHAIVGAGHGSRIVSITVVAGSRTFGHVKRQDNFPPDLVKQMYDTFDSDFQRAHMIELAATRVRISLAGHAAERVLGYSLSMPRGKGSDATVATAYADAVAPARCDLRAHRREWLGRGMKEARRYLRCYWPHVQVLARELLKHGTVEGDHLDALLNIEGLRPLVRPGWRTIAKDG